MPEQVKPASDAMVAEWKEVAELPTERGINMDRHTLRRFIARIERDREEKRNGILPDCWGRHGTGEEAGEGCSADCTVTEECHRICWLDDQYEQDRARITTLEQQAERDRAVVEAAKNLHKRMKRMPWASWRVLPQTDEYVKFEAALAQREGSSNGVH